MDQHRNHDTTEASNPRMNARALTRSDVLDEWEQLRADRDRLFAAAQRVLNMPHRESDSDRKERVEAMCGLREAVRVSRQGRV